MLITMFFLFPKVSVTDILYNWAKRLKKTTKNNCFKS